MLSQVAIVLSAQTELGMPDVRYAALLYIGVWVMRHEKVEDPGKWVIKI
jgi:hypothetical protein